MFSALRQGNSFYILEKENAPVLKIGLIESVSQPKFSTTTPFNTVVDITVKVNGERVEFKGIPSNLSIANFGTTGIVVSESKEAMSTEVDGMLQSSKQILENVDYHKGVVEKCELILKQLNPAFAKEQERDDAIDGLSKRVDDIAGEFASVRGDLTKVLNLLSNAQTRNSLGYGNNRGEMQTPLQLPNVPGNA